MSIKKAKIFILRYLFYRFTFEKRSDIIKLDLISRWIMDGMKFTLTRIEGEYAYLSPVDGGDDVFIALALLPQGSDIGSTLECKDFSFELC